jgi:hypothetical protein
MSSVSSPSISDELLFTAEQAAMEAKEKFYADPNPAKALHT